MKKVILKSIALLILIILPGWFNFTFGDTTKRQNKSMKYKTELKIVGKIKEIHFGAEYDSDDTITVDKYMIAFFTPNQMGSQADLGPVGKLIGFGDNFDGSLENKKRVAGLIGSKVEVFAKIDYLMTEDGQPSSAFPPTYSLYGSEKYYIKILKPWYWPF